MMGGIGWKPCNLCAFGYKRFYRVLTLSSHIGMNMRINP